MNTHRLSFLALAFSVVFLAACGGDGDTRNAPTALQEPSAVDTEDAAQAADVPAYDGPAFEMTITPVGNQMEYEQKEFTVKPGQTVRLTFENTATSPAMSHNVVVLQMNASINEVGQAAMTAADTDYIPASHSDQILAYTPMAAPGETVTVEFTAPAEGAYDYICTFPGHYMIMQGKMHVVA